MNDVVVMYLCDRKACVRCDNPECHYTVDIRHAVNFEYHNLGVRDYFNEKGPGDDFLSRLLTPEAIKFINRYPKVINDLAYKHEKLIKEALKQTEES